MHASLIFLLLFTTHIGRYFHLKARSSSAAKLLDRIKEEYFIGTSERKLPDHLLEAASESLPESFRTHGVAKDAKFYDATFTICLQGVNVLIILQRISSLCCAT